MNTAKAKSKIDGKSFLKEAFSMENTVLLSRLKQSESISHDGSKGDVNEKHFIDVLRRYLPKRYAVDSGIVIDSTGATSDQIDIVVYDNHFTPTLLDQANHRYIPAEAVYAIFEVKPKIDKGYMEYAGDKAKSVRSLKRTSVEITHAGGVYSARELFDIFAGLIAKEVEWKDGFSSESFKKCHESLTGDESIECALAVDSSCFDNFNDDLKVHDSEGVLAFFMFRLLGKLQSLGSVSAVDWSAYADVFSKKEG